MPVSGAEAGFKCSPPVSHPTPSDEPTVPMSAAGQTAESKDGARSNGAHYRNKGWECLHLESGGKHDAANDGEEASAIEADDTGHCACVASRNHSPTEARVTVPTGAREVCDKHARLYWYFFFYRDLECFYLDQRFLAVQKTPHARETPPRCEVKYGHLRCWGMNQTHSLLPDKATPS